VLILDWGLELSAGAAVRAAGSVGASVGMELELVLETEFLLGLLLVLELEGARVRVNQNEAWPWYLSRGWIWCGFRSWSWFLCWCLWTGVGYVNGVGAGRVSKLR
jgi:hypothetical protein